MFPSFAAGKTVCSYGFLLGAFSASQTDGNICQSSVNCPRAKMDFI